MFDLLSWCFIIKIPPKTIYSSKPEKKFFLKSQRVVSQRKGRIYLKILKSINPKWLLLFFSRIQTIGKSSFIIYMYMTCQLLEELWEIVCGFLWIFTKKQKIETSFIIKPLKYKIQTHSFTLDLDSLFTSRDLLFIHDFLFVLLFLDISLKKKSYS